jgi:hypothetical protein
VRPGVAAPPNAAVPPNAALPINGVIPASAVAPANPAAPTSSNVQAVPNDSQVIAPRPNAARIAATRAAGD